MYPYELFWGVHLYGVMISIGLLCCFAVLYIYAKLWKIKEKFVDFIFFTGVGAIIFGFFAAAVFQGLYNYIENPSAGFHIDGGITVMGGLVGGAGFFLVIYFLLRKRYKERLYQIVSIIPCCALIAHAFGRIGCFFAGCCYGKETDSFLGVQFPGLPSPVHPTQLYEAVFLFLLFGVCSFLALKKKYQHNLSLYLVVYGLFRFLIEFLRDDSRGELIVGISPSQFLSLLFIVGGVAVYFYQRWLLQKNPISATADGTEQPTEHEEGAQSEPLLEKEQVTAKTDNENESEGNKYENDHGDRQ